MRPGVIRGDQRNDATVDSGRPEGSASRHTRLSVERPSVWWPHSCWSLSTRPSRPNRSLIETWEWTVGETARVARTRATSRPGGSPLHVLDRSSGFPGRFMSSGAGQGLRGAAVAGALRAGTHAIRAGPATRPRLWRGRFRPTAHAAALFQRLRGPAPLLDSPGGRLTPATVRRHTDCARAMQ